MRSPRVMLLIIGVACCAAFEAAAGPADPSRIDGFTERAKAFAQKKQYAQAIELLDANLEADPSHRRSAELRGFCRMKLQEFDGACEDFERGDATHAYHDVNYGYCLRKVGRLEEARQRFTAALGKIQKDDAWNAYAQDQLRTLANLDGAKQVLALASVKDHAIVRAGGQEIGRVSGDQDLGLALDRLPDDVELSILVLNVDGDWSYRLKIFDGSKVVFQAGGPSASARAVAATGVHLTGLVGLWKLKLARRGGVLTIAEAKDGVAIDDAARVADEIERRLSAEERDEAIALLEGAVPKFGTIAWFPRRLAETVDAQAAALPLNPQNADRRKALQTRAREQWTRCYEIQKNVANLAPNDFAAVAIAAAAASQLGKFDEAETFYRGALKTDPKNLDLLIGIASALTHQKRGAEAVAFADQALAVESRMPLVHVTRGDALLGAGQPEPALLAYVRGVELDPTQGEWIYGKIALAQNTGGANATGIKQAEKALREAQNDAVAVARLGYELLRGLRFEESMETFKNALSRRSDVPGASGRAGLAAELAGKTRDAIDLYQKPESDPDIAALAKRRVERLAILREAESWQPPMPQSERVPLKQVPDGPEKELALKALGAIKAQDESLALGLLRLPPLGDGVIATEDANACARIAKLVGAAGTDKEIALGLSLLAAQVSKQKEAPQVDGALAEWQPEDRLASDPAGDAEGAADLAELSAKVSGQDVYIAWRVHGIPDPRAVGYWVELRGEPIHGTIAVGVGGGETKLIRALPDRGKVQVDGDRTQVVWKAGQGVEAKIPLRWLRGMRRMRVSGFSFDPKSGRTLDRIAEQQPVPAVDDGFSPGLLALFQLAARIQLEPSDRLALAIALASSDAFAIGGKEVEARLAEDNLRFLVHAREQRDAGKTRGWPALDAMPFEALLSFASRSVQYRPGTASGYVRYSVSPVTLTAMARYAEKNGLVKSSVVETVGAIEAHLGSPRRWQYTAASAVEMGARLTHGQGTSLSESDRADLDKFVRAVTIDGLETTTDGTFNQDLLFDHLVATDALVGHCGNMAQAVVDMCRALGIPGTIAQGREEQSTLYANPHAFPIFFDGGAARWTSIQGRRYQGERPLALYIFLPPAITRLPAEARSAGGGTHWYRIETTYDEVGASFRRGYEFEWYRKWLAAVKNP